MIRLKQVAQMSLFLACVSLAVTFNGIIRQDTGEVAVAALLTVISLSYTSYVLVVIGKKHKRGRIR